MEQDEIREVVLTTMEASLALQLRAVRQMQNKEDLPAKERVRTGRRRQSVVDLTLQVLTEEGRPMHVNEIVESLRTKHGRVTDRDSLSSALAKKARQHILVVQTAPATFDLLKEKQ